jgi:hypothetical protein
MRCNAPPAEGHTFAGVITSNGDFLQAPTTETEPYTPAVRGTRIYRNDGGSFTDVTIAGGITDSVNVRQLGWVDYDLDGWLDLFVMNKGDTKVHNGPDVLYRNMGNGSFLDVTTEQKLGGPSTGLGDAFSFEDYDTDGDLDVAMLSGSGPRFFGLHSKHHLYRNDGPVGNSLRVDLEGDSSTPDGYGAWVTCVSATAGTQVHYVTGNAWRGGAVKLEPHFGLGLDSIVLLLTVEWPSGIWSVLADVPAGSVTVDEQALVSDAPHTAKITPPLRMRAHPNPSPQGVSFEIEGRGSSPAALEIYDTSGRLVSAATLVGPKAEWKWEGRTRTGAAAASGVYFARLREEKREAITRFVLIRR